MEWTSLQGQLPIDQGVLLSRIHADMKERLKNQDQRLSSQGRLLSCIHEILDHGEPTDVDTDVDEALDDDPRRVKLEVPESERLAPGRMSVMGRLLSCWCHGCVANCDDFWKQVAKPQSQVNMSDDLFEGVA